MDSLDKKKQKLKVVKYEIVSIPRHYSINKEYFLFNNILIDFEIRNNMPENRFSSWNYCAKM